MLLKFAIEPSAFDVSRLPSQSLDDYKKDRKAEILRVLRFWRCHGMLMDSGGRLGDMLLQTGPQGPQLLPVVRELLMSGYKQYGVISGADIDWESINSTNAMGAVGEDPFGIEVAFLEETRADAVWRTGETDEFCSHCGEVEVTLLKHVNEACKIQHAANVAQAAIPPDQTATEIWAERFRSYAKYARKVVVVDRNAVRNLNGRGGLFPLLHFLDEDCRKTNVEIYATSKYPGDLPSDTKENLEPFVEGLNRGGVRRVDAYLFPDDGRVKHGRYLRFDDRLFVLDDGIEVLGRGARSDPSACILHRAEGYVDLMKRDVEKPLRNYFQRSSVSTDMWDEAGPAHLTVWTKSSRP